MNAVLVRGDAVGSTLYYGAGAGAQPTASAVIADLVDVARALVNESGDEPGKVNHARVPHLGFQPGALADSPILPIAQIETSYYLRLTAVNRPGVLAAITRIFGDNAISIDTILQKGRGRPNDKVTIIMLTQTTRELNINEAMDKLTRLDAIIGDIVRIRLENLG